MKEKHFDFKFSTQFSHDDWYDNTCFAVIAFNIQTWAHFKDSTRKKNKNNILLISLYFCLWRQSFYCDDLHYVSPFQMTKNERQTYRLNISIAIHFVLSAIQSENFLFKNPVHILLWYNQNTVIALFPLSVCACVFVSIY